jgi:hypothetical protein
LQNNFGGTAGANPKAHRQDNYFEKSALGEKKSDYGGEKKISVEPGAAADVSELHSARKWKNQRRAMVLLTNETG